MGIIDLIMVFVIADIHMKTIVNIVKIPHIDVI